MNRKYLLTAMMYDYGQPIYKETVEFYNEDSAEQGFIKYCKEKSFDYELHIDTVVKKNTQSAVILTSDLRLMWWIKLEVTE